MFLLCELYHLFIVPCFCCVKHITCLLFHVLVIGTMELPITTINEINCTPARPQTKTTDSNLNLLSTNQTVSNNDTMFIDQSEKLLHSALFSVSSDMGLDSTDLLLYEQNENEGSCLPGINQNNDTCSSGIIQNNDTCLSGINQNTQNDPMINDVHIRTIPQTLSLVKNVGGAGNVQGAENVEDVGNVREEGGNVKEVGHMGMVGVDAGHRSDCNQEPHCCRCARKTDCDSATLHVERESHENIVEKHPLIVRVPDAGAYAFDSLKSLAESQLGQAIETVRQNHHVLLTLAPDFIDTEIYDEDKMYNSFPTL